MSKTVPPSIVFIRPGQQRKMMMTAGQISFAYSLSGPDIGRFKTDEARLWMYFADVHSLRVSFSTSLITYTDVSTRLKFIGIFSAYYRRRDQNWAGTFSSEHVDHGRKFKILTLAYWRPRKVHSSGKLWGVDCRA